MVAVAAVGVVTGIATGLIEGAVKTAWLRGVAGAVAGWEFVLYRDPTCIGSSRRGEVYLFRDPLVSARHAVIRATAGGYEIEDLHMGGGTFVNGRSVDRAGLRDGDEVRVGSTRLVFRERA